MCRFQVPIRRVVERENDDIEKLGDKTEEGRKRTPRIHSRYKSSTRLRWWMEFVDTAAARARRVGIVVMDPRRHREITFDGPDGRGRLDLVGRPSRTFPQSGHPGPAPPVCDSLSNCANCTHSKES